MASIVASASGFKNIMDWLRRIRIAASALVLIAVSCIVGCGGELGGAPGGISATLTNVQLNAAVFGLGLADVNSVSTQVPGGTVAAVDATSFSITLVGAGFDRRDVSFSFDIPTSGSASGLPTTDVSGALPPSLENIYTIPGGDPRVKVVAMVQELDSSGNVVTISGTPKPPLRIEGNELKEVSNRTIGGSTFVAGNVRSGVQKVKPIPGLFDYRVLAERLLNKENFEVILEFQQNGVVGVGSNYRVLFTTLQRNSIVQNGETQTKLILTKGYNEGSLGDPTLQYSAPTFLNFNVRNIPASATGVVVTAIEEKLNEPSGGGDERLTKFELPIRKAQLTGSTYNVNLLVINRLRRFRVEARAFVEADPVNNPVGRFAPIAYTATRPTSEATPSGFLAFSSSNTAENNGFKIRIPANVGNLTIPNSDLPALRSQIVEKTLTTAALTNPANTYAAVRDGDMLTIGPLTPSLLFSPPDLVEPRTVSFNSSVQVIEIGSDQREAVRTLEIPNEVDNTDDPDDLLPNGALTYEETTLPKLLTEIKDGKFKSITNPNPGTRVVRSELSAGVFTDIVPAVTQLRSETSILAVTASLSKIYTVFTRQANTTPLVAPFDYPVRARSIRFVIEELNSTLITDTTAVVYTGFVNAVGDADLPNRIPPLPAAGLEIPITDRNRFYKITVEARSAPDGGGVALLRGVKDFDGVTAGIQGAIHTNDPVEILFTDSTVTSSTVVSRVGASSGPINLRRGQTVALTSLLEIDGVNTVLNPSNFSYTVENDPSNMIDVSSAGEVTFRNGAPSGVLPTANIDNIRVRTTYNDPVLGAISGTIRFIVTGTGTGVVN